MKVILFIFFFLFNVGFLQAKVCVFDVYQNGKKLPVQKVKDGTWFMVCESYTWEGIYYHLLEIKKTKWCKKDGKHIK